MSLNNEELIIKLREENCLMKTTNQLLESDLIRLKKLITTLEDIKTISFQFIKQCKCGQQSNKYLKLKKLKSNYEQLKNESYVGLCHNNNNNKTYHFMLKNDLNDNKSRVIKPFVKENTKTKTKRKENINKKTITIPIGCHWPGCDEVFRDHHDLNDHMWRHTGQKQFICEWPGCDKRFPIKRNLIRHQIIHEQQKQHSCDWPGCEFKCWYAQGLRVHRLRHNDERPYKCSWPHCVSTFRQSHHLKSHMLKHTGEKPFGCDWPECCQRFQSRQAMRFHIQRVHKS